MNKKIGPYHTGALPVARRHIFTVIDLIWWKHWIYGLLEVDVTLAKQFIEAFEARTGEGPSFTWWAASPGNSQLWMTASSIHLVSKH